MGVPGLYRFFSGNPQLFDKYELRDTTVIIDGLNVCHQLYLGPGIDFAYGGDYDKYAKGVQDYFLNLKMCNVEAIVILDGARDVSERKIQGVERDIIKRLRAFNNISKYGIIKERFLPILAIDVFKVVLSEMGICLSQSDFEADEQIAALAKLLGCPVISNDSDFLIYDIPGGVIRLDSLDFSVSQKKDYFFIGCDMYNIKGFLKHFPGLNCDVLPLVGTLLGNDYISGEIFHNFFDNIKLPKKTVRTLNTSRNQIRIVALFQWLEKKSVETAIELVLPYLKKEEREHVEGLIRNVMAGYTHCFNQMEDYMSSRSCLVKHSRLGLRNNSTTPTWFLEDFHSVRLNRFIADVLMTQRVFLMSQAEEPKQSSAHQCSFQIRKAIYSIVLCSSANATATVYEHDRKDSNLKMKAVEVSNMTQAPDLNTLPDCPIEDKRQFLMDLLSCKYSWICEFPPGWEILVACLQFLVRNATPLVTREFISAVLLSCLLLSLDELYKDSKELRQHVSLQEIAFARMNLKKYFQKPCHNYAKVFLTRVVHCFSQLQSCLLYVSCLNSLLNEPLPVLRTHVLLNGSFIYAMTCNLEGRPNVSLFISEALGRGSGLETFFSGLVTKLLEVMDSERFACVKNKTRAKHEKKVIKHQKKDFSVLSLDDSS